MASLLLPDRETRLAIATIPSPQLNIASEKQGSGLSLDRSGETGRKERGKEMLDLEVEPV